MDIDKLANTIRLYLMEHGDAVTDGLRKGIDSTGIHQDMARYIANRM